MPVTVFAVVPIDITANVSPSFKQDPFVNGISSNGCFQSRVDRNLSDNEGLLVH